MRNLQDADWLVGALKSDFTPLVFDVTDAEGVRAGAATVAEGLEGRTLAALINNAGKPAS